MWSEDAEVMFLTEFDDEPGMSFGCKCKRNEPIRVALDPIWDDWCIRHKRTDRPRYKVGTPAQMLDPEKTANEQGYACLYGSAHVTFMLADE